MLDFIPLYQLAIAPKDEWPVGLHGKREAITVIRKNSGTLVFHVWINIEVRTGASDALKLARYFVKQNNTTLTAHRREQARNRATRLKVIKEKHHVNAA